MNSSSIENPVSVFTSALRPFGKLSASLRSVLFMTVLLILLFFLQSCLRYTPDHPMNPESPSYMGDLLARDRNNNGYADIYDIYPGCDGVMQCMVDSSIADGYYGQSGFSQELEIDADGDGFVDLFTQYPGCQNNLDCLFEQAATAGQIPGLSTSVIAVLSSTTLSSETLAQSSATAPISSVNLPNSSTASSSGTTEVSSSSSSSTEASPSSSEPSSSAGTSSNSSGCFTQVVSDMEFNTDGTYLVPGHSATAKSYFQAGDLVVVEGDDCSCAVTVSSTDDWNLYLSAPYSCSSGTRIHISKVVGSANSSSSQSSGTTVEISPSCPSWTPKTANTRVVGFYTSWEVNKLAWAEVEFDKLTHIMLAFALPNSNGTLNAGSVYGNGNLSSVISTAHAAGVKVMVSVGGATASNFRSVLVDDTKRFTLAQATADYVANNCLDGADFDFEGWDGGADNIATHAADFLALLYPALDAHGLELSADVFGTSWNGQHFNNTAMQYVHFINIMAYDFTGSWSAEGQHSSYADASSSLFYWTVTRGLAKNKAVLGVPFYGKDFSAGGANRDYRDIITTYGGSSTADQIGQIYYNGTTTITQKTELVVNGSYGGIMIWDINTDSQTPSSSLLKAIHDASGN